MFTTGSCIVHTWLANMYEKGPVEWKWVMLGQADIQELLWHSMPGVLEQVILKTNHEVH